MVPELATKTHIDSIIDNDWRYRRCLACADTFATMSDSTGPLAVKTASVDRCDSKPLKH